MTKENGYLESVDFWTGKGLLRIKPNAVVDATDTGVVAGFAGEEMVRGRKGDGKTQVASWVFDIGHIDFGPLEAYWRENPDDLRPFPLADPAGHIRDALAREGFVGGAFRRLVAKAEADGMKLPRAIMPGSFLPKLGRFITVATRVEDVDPDDSRSHTRGELEGMAQVERWLDFLRRYVPGFSRCTLEGTAAYGDWADDRPYEERREIGKKLGLAPK